MSYKYFVTDKQQKHPKVHSEQYLYGYGEPRDSKFQDLPTELEAELLKKVNYMRQRIRHMVQAMRSHP